MKTFSEIKNSASKIISQYQTGKITKSELYNEGAELTMQFNEIPSPDEKNADYQSSVSLLMAIKHMATV